MVISCSFPNPCPAPSVCSDYSFICKDKVCVNKVNAECDRIDDCADRSDEKDCAGEIRRDSLSLSLSLSLSVSLCLSLSPLSTHSACALYGVESDSLSS